MVLKTYHTLDWRLIRERRGTIFAGSFEAAAEETKEGLLDSEVERADNKPSEGCQGRGARHDEETAG
jgi:hypothetical protein